MTYSLNISKSRMNHQACSLLSPFLPSTHPPFTMEKVELKGRPTTIQARTASCAASTLCVQQVIWSNWESPKLCGWWSYIYIYNIYIYMYCIIWWCKHSKWSFNDIYWTLLIHDQFSYMLYVPEVGQPRFFWLHQIGSEYTIIYISYIYIYINIS